MKKSYTIILSFILLCLIMITLFFLSDYKKVSVVEEESYFKDFTINSTKVYFEYRITLENGSNQPKEVRLVANKKEDVELGLIEKPELTGINKADGTKSFIIPAKASDIYEVEFIGEFTGNYQKANRMLPEITIQEVKQ